jgi:hypothetical protein
MKRFPLAAAFLAGVIAGVLPCGLLADVSTSDNVWRLHTAPIIGVLLPPHATVAAAPGARPSWISDSLKQRPAYALAGISCPALKAPLRRRPVAVELRHRFQTVENGRIGDRAPPHSCFRFDQ